ncbi:MAG: succinylglutamate desuccinylase/aspartoacylase family protein [Saprospiraceae bacterium]|jgi:predicted deacylase|nr:succinylglutamate desuccinylase/aspartoacylase family protein [Saprospiraceae bacterium]
MSNISIQGQDFQPGSSGLVRINAGKLPSGNRISIFTYIFRSRVPGPTALFLGGMHGDEINGVEIIRRSIHENMFSQLKSGTVIAIPLLNIFGFINFSRDVPDGKDVNRSFPGSVNGSLASRIARIVTKKILPLVDFGVDFHTGGDHHWNYPQVRYSTKHGPSKELALKTNYELLIEKSIVSKSLRKIAKAQHKPILVFEGGGALRIENFVVQKGQQVIRNLLEAHKMLEGPKPQNQVNRVFKKTDWERAPESGMLTYSRQAGSYVKHGEVLGIISDPFAQREVKMFASRDGFIIGHNNAPVINVGDGMFHIAYEEEKYVASVIS